VLSPVRVLLGYPGALCGNRPDDVRLITWNVAKRVSAVAEQAAALGERAADVVALQELTARSWPMWRAALDTLGYTWSACSLDDADSERQPISRRRGGVLLAARGAAATAPSLVLPRPETTLAATVDDVTVHTVHVPNAANGWVKVETLEAVRAGLAASDGPRVLCGDLNTPRRESPDGAVMSFARESSGRLREERGERWDAGELGVVPGLRDLGFTDAFRALHGYAEKSPSWTYPRGGGGYRIDHAFLSSDLVAVAGSYHHAWRDVGLSDHAALEVEFTARSRR
jgi:exonuclease III